jgi:hypothetical protein
MQAAGCAQVDPVCAHTTQNNTQFQFNGQLFNVLMNLRQSERVQYICRLVIVPEVMCFRTQSKALYDACQCMIGSRSGRVRKRVCIINACQEGAQTREDQSALSDSPPLRKALPSAGSR